MEYARLLEKENRFFCVRCIAAEAFLVLWEQMFSVGRVIAVPKASMRPRSASARGGSLAAHGKRVIPFAVTEEKTFCRTFFYPSFNDGDILRTYGTRKDLKIGK